MRPRKDPQGAFLERTEEQWRALGVPERYLSRYTVLPALGWHKLAMLGALRPDEVARLRRIASGTESHPRITIDRAQQLLDDHDHATEDDAPDPAA
ncbi:hypothetical protein ACGFRG_15225 [Streptomyces sp. NPDC048696]|uniref:hypothetical protein n=1 Tax=Streptomyces sp. NPDC048696 TaxID=3365585 RepID=UPI00371E450C